MNIYEVSNIFKYLDYDKSLLSIVASVLNYYGVETLHKTLQPIDKLLSKHYKNVVVMLFDGMGTSILEKHLDEKSFLRKHFTQSISSVFPPTTTAATISMETGLSPIEHGWLGWSLYFDELEENVSIFPNTISGSDGIQAAKYNVAHKYIPYQDIFQKIEKTTNGKVLAKRVSPFSEYKSQSVKEICDTVIDLCSQDKEKYIYTYWNQPDYDMHDYGTEHPRIKAELLEINNLLELLASSVSDTLLIITADHGLIDTDWIYLNNYPDLEDCLLRKPSIESRAMTFFIKPDKKREFEELFKKDFTQYYDLYTKAEVIAESFFGNGRVNNRVDGFIGDYLAVAKSNVSIAASLPMEHDIFKAAHAGITKDELTIPLIIVER